ncbi:MAG: hypothetical protein JWO36_2211 [Myxococcales bacterium]|nr:hypothetical protein [Myxococcales bacterium]
MVAPMTTTLRLLLLSLFVFVAIPAVASADTLADAKAVISKQVAQINTGDVAGLKAGFTKRQQPKITDAAVKKAADQVGKMSIDELVASATGDKTEIKIKMKNGRTLTTLLKVDGKWLADTLWFK